MATEEEGQTTPEEAEPKIRPTDEGDLQEAMEWFGKEAVAILGMPGVISYTDPQEVEVVQTNVGENVWWLIRAMCYVRDSTA